MKKLLIEYVIGSLLFVHMLEGSIPAIRSLNLVSFVIIMLALYFLAFIAFMNLGMIIKYLFYLLCGVGLGPIYLPPFAIELPPEGSVRIYCSLRAFGQCTISH